MSESGPSIRIPQFAGFAYKTGELLNPISLATMFQIGSNANKVSSHTGLSIKQLIESAKSSDENARALETWRLSLTAGVPSFQGLPMLPPLSGLSLQREISNSGLSSIPFFTPPSVPSIPPALKGPVFRDQLLLAFPPPHLLLPPQRQRADPIGGRDSPITNPEVMQARANGDVDFYNNVLHYNNYGIDRDALNLMNLLRDKPLFYDALKKAMEVAFSSGTEEGLLYRLKHQFSLVDRVALKLTAKKKSLIPMNIEAIAKYLPLLDFRGVFISLEHSVYKMNKIASYGMPYPKKKMGDLYFHLVTSIMLIESLLINSNYHSYYEKHLDEYIILVKNKASLYTYNELKTKVRPYYVPPGALRYAQSALFEFVAAQFRLFNDKTPGNLSIKMVGFSWAHGGTESIFEVIWSVTVDQPRAFSYGDDCQFAYFYAELGVWILICLDISALDSSFRVEDLPYLKEIYSKLFYSRLGKHMHPFLLSIIEYSLQAPVLFPHGIILLKAIGMHSGCVGTTHHDDMLMARPISVILDRKDVIHSIYYPIDDLISDIIDTFLCHGIVVKPGSVVYDTIYPKAYYENRGKTATKCTILGQRLATDNLYGTGVVYYPEPDFSKLLVSYCHGGPPPDKIETWAWKLMRICGLLLSGGCFDLDVYNYLSRQYNAIMTSREHDVTEQIYDVFMASNSMEISLTAPWLPDFSYCKLFKKTVPDRELLMKIYTEPLSVFKNIASPNYSEKIFTKVLFATDEPEDEEKKEELKEVEPEPENPARVGLGTAADAMPYPYQSSVVSRSINFDDLRYSGLFGPPPTPAALLRRQKRTEARARVQLNMTEEARSRREVKLVKKRKIGNKPLTEEASEEVSDERESEIQHLHEVQDTDELMRTLENARKLASSEETPMRDV
jgi:hypothetical protein